MSDSQKNWEDELDELMIGLDDESLAKEDADRLSHLLQSQPEAQLRFAKHRQLVSLLETELPFTSPKADLVASNKNADPSDKRNQLFYPSKSLFWTSAAVLVAAVFTIAWLSQFGSDSTQDALAQKDLTDTAHEPEHEGVAVITQAFNPSWTSEKKFGVGSTVPPGPIHLHSGLLQLEFYQGAIVVVEGPAKLELIDANKLVCHSGKLRARVPEAAEGFTVETPKIKVVDLGTEFGVEVKITGESSVHVFSGEIELTSVPPNRDTQKQKILSGRAALISKNGNAKLFKASSQHFVSPSKIRKMTRLAWQNRLKAWKEHTSKRKQDSRVIASLSFEPVEGFERKLVGHIPEKVQNNSGIKESVGAIVGCSWVEGRWPGKPALEFKRPSDRVKVDIPGSYSSLTLSAWVRVDGLDRILNALLTTNYFGPGGIQWQMDRKGRLILAVRHPKKGHKYRSPVVVDLAGLGNWIHLTTVYDSDTETVSHFVNGSRISEESFAEKRTDLVLGKSEVGNWGRRLPSGRKKIRNFNGRMDDLVVFNKALTRQEIQELYQAGKP